MPLIGVGITAKTELPGKPTFFVKYLRCDQCGIEFRLYYRTDKELKEALEEIAKMLGADEKEVLCFTCLSGVPADQGILTF